MIGYDVSTIDGVFVCRAVGLVGVSIYVLGFFALCTGRLTSSTPVYFLLNFCAASCVMVSLSVDFNLSSALIQGFYIVMSLCGVWRRRRRFVRAQGVVDGMPGLRVAKSPTPTFVSGREPVGPQARLQ